MSLLLRRRMLIANSQPQVKNLMNPEKFLYQYTYAGVTIKRDGDGFTIKGTSTRTVYIGIFATPDKYVAIPETMRNKTLYVSITQTGLRKNDRFPIGIKGEGKTDFFCDVTANQEPVLLEIPEGYTDWFIRMDFTINTTYDDRFTIMISEEPHTEFVPYEE